MKSFKTVIDKHMNYTYKTKLRPISHSNVGYYPNTVDPGHIADDLLKAKIEINTKV